MDRTFPGSSDCVVCLLSVFAGAGRGNFQAVASNEIWYREINCGKAADNVLRNGRDNGFLFGRRSDSEFVLFRIWIVGTFFAKCGRVYFKPLQNQRMAIFHHDAGMEDFRSICICVCGNADRSIVSKNDSNHWSGSRDYVAGSSLLSHDWSGICFLAGQGNESGGNLGYMQYLF